MKEIMQYVTFMIKDTLSLFNIFDSKFTVFQRILNFIVGLIYIGAYLIGIMCVLILLQDAILRL